MSAFSSEREANIHCARVLLAQARHFRLRGSAFSFTLLEWAGNSRRRAMEPKQAPTGAQGDLFA